MTANKVRVKLRGVYSFVDAALDASDIRDDAGVLDNVAQRSEIFSDSHYRSAQKNIVTVTKAFINRLSHDIHNTLVLSLIQRRFASAGDSDGVIRM
jgi:hypothetical protein